MSDSLSTQITLKPLHSPKQNFIKTKNPSLLCRATPVTLYSNKDISVPSTQRIKTEGYELKQLHNPYEYYFNTKRKIEYSQNQAQLQQQVCMEEDQYKTQTFSLKYIGSKSKNEGFGIKTQRRYIPSISNYFELPKDSFEPDIFHDFRQTNRFNSNQLRAYVRNRDNTKSEVKSQKKPYFSYSPQKNVRVRHERLRQIKGLNKVKDKTYHNPENDIPQQPTYNSYSRNLQRIAEVQSSRVFSALKTNRTNRSERVTLGV